MIKTNLFFDFTGFRRSNLSDDEEEEEEGFPGGEEEEEELPPLPPVYVFVRQPRALNRVEVHVKQCCYLLRIGINTARRRYGKAIALTTAVQLFLIEEANRRQREEVEARETEDKRMRQELQEERMLGEGGMDHPGNTPRGSGGGGGGGGGGGSVAVLGSIVEEGKTNNTKEEPEVDEEGNVIGKGWGHSPHLLAASHSPHLTHRRALLFLLLFLLLFPPLFCVFFFASSSSFFLLPSSFFFFFLLLFLATFFFRPAPPVPQRHRPRIVVAVPGQLLASSLDEMNPFYRT